MILIYRGEIFKKSTPPSIQPYRKPRALNWRFHAPGETYDNTSISALIYSQPRALNWRYCGTMSV